VRVERDDGEAERDRGRPPSGHSATWPRRGCRAR
jgi:hypothetical protein